MRYEQLNGFYFVFTNKGKLTKITTHQPQEEMNSVHEEYKNSFIRKNFGYHLEILKQEFFNLIEEGLKQEPENLYKRLNDNLNSYNLIETAIVWCISNQENKWQYLYSKIKRKYEEDIL